ncbi:hypothetical protein C1645_825249 [Glomus cerebriforme]|uniref:Uncharacterized protein n=1 Tax=Glomus cerebriforme TaxID=658196 RepID=A0A397T289_9GLOM|nr:hypothetical protein C1645_825249 [Glomus cerebriforme]
MHAEIPKLIDKSFYHGNVHVGLKDPIFELSSAARYFVKLYEIVDKTDKPYLFLYTDGEPDHQKNPVERIMSILNLRLQCVGLMHQEMETELEEIMSKCNSMSDIRKAAKKVPNLKEDKNFKTFNAASELDIDILWNSILQIDSTLTKEDKSWANIKNKANHLPNPVLANNKYYKSFSDIYHTETNELYCLSIQTHKAKLDKHKKKARHNKQIPKVLDNDNALSDMESEEEKEAEILNDESSMIPIQLEDEEDTNTGTKRNNMNQELKDVLSKIFVNASLECYDKMEKAYYSANFLPICFNCSSSEYTMPIPEKQYPYCETCTSDPGIEQAASSFANMSAASLYLLFECALTLMQYWESMKIVTSVLLSTVRRAVKMVIASDLVDEVL